MRGWWWLLCGLWACLWIGVLTASCDGGPAQAAAGTAAGSWRYVGSLPCAGCRAVRMDVLLQPRGAQAQRFSLLRTQIGLDGSQRVQQVEGQWKRRTTDDGQAVYLLQPSDRRQPAIVLAGNDQRTFAREVGAAAAPTGGWLHRIDSPRAPDTLDLGPGDGLAPVSVAPGQRIRVHLRSSPATGYEWHLEAPPQEVVAIESDPGSVVQLQSQRTWGFRALRRGRVTLRFGYGRPWEASTLPVRTASFEVLIR